MKTCSKCQIEKPYSDFGKASNNKDGYKGQCRSCISDYRTKDYNRRPEVKEATHKRETKPERKAARSAQRKAKQPEHNARILKWRHKNPDKSNAIVRKSAWKKAGIEDVDTLDWDAYLESAEGKCSLCGIEYTKPMRDHDHSTGLTRGVLCVKCNTALGVLGDNEEGLLRALDYLRNPPADPFRML